MSVIKLYCDAATKGNPGPSGLGALIVDGQGQVQLSQPVAGPVSNHQAELMAAAFGLQAVIDRYPDTRIVSFYTDSQLLADAINKRYAKHYAAELAPVLALVDRFDLVIINHLSDHQNQGAHHLANQALQRAL